MHLAPIEAFFSPLSSLYLACYHGFPYAGLFSTTLLLTETLSLETLTLSLSPSRTRL